jgi:predicted transcriptional regulator of viral defense system
MGDRIQHRPDFAALFAIASTQHGLFTITQARRAGFSDSLVSYHTSTGMFRRINRGVYRLRDYPSTPYEGVAAAWLAAGAHRSVVSHESALELHDLSDVIPQAIHLTVPRSMRHHPDLPGVRIHTTTRTFGPSDVTAREGIRVTSVPRSIVDAADAGTSPEQIELAVRQAVQRGLTTSMRLEAAMRNRNKRVQDLIRNAVGAKDHEIRDR